MSDSEVSSGGEGSAAVRTKIEPKDEKAAGSVASANGVEDDDDDDGEGGGDDLFGGGDDEDEDDDVIAKPVRQRRKIE